MNNIGKYSDPISEGRIFMEVEPPTYRERIVDFLNRFDWGVRAPILFKLREVADSKSNRRNFKIGGLALAFTILVSGAGCNFGTSTTRRSCPSLNCTTPTYPPLPSPTPTRMPTATSEIVPTATSTEIPSPVPRITETPLGNPITVWQYLQMPCNDGQKYLFNRAYIVSNPFTSSDFPGQTGILISDNPNYDPNSNTLSPSNDAMVVYVDGNIDNHNLGDQIRYSGTCRQSTRSNGTIDWVINDGKLYPVVTAYSNENVIFSHI